MRERNIKIKKRTVMPVFENMRSIKELDNAISFFKRNIKKISIRRRRLQTYFKVNI